MKNILYAIVISLFSLTIFGSEKDNCLSEQLLKGVIITKKNQHPGQPEKEYFILMPNNMAQEINELKEKHARHISFYEDKIASLTAENKTLRATLKARK
jgi:hypothetical protein